MTERRLARRVDMFPRDTNAWGTIFGGVMLGYIDLAGADEARRYARRHYVTKIMREVNFVAPALVGDTVNFYTRIVRVGRTSITVRIEVIAERFKTGEEIKVTEAEIVYVAIDENGRPTPIKEGNDG